MTRFSFIPELLTKDDFKTLVCSGNITEVKEFTPSLTDETFYRPSSEFVRELPFMNHDNLCYDFPNGIENHSVDVSLRKPIEDISILSVKARASKRSVDEMLNEDLDEQIFNERIKNLESSGTNSKPTKPEDATSSRDA